MATRQDRPERAEGRSAMLCAGLVLWGALWGVWAWIRPSLTLQLGSLHDPTWDHRVFLTWYVTAGTLTVVALARGLAGRPTERLAAFFRRGSDRAWIGALCVAALVLALAAHFLVLQRMHVTDDESAYLFAARVVASGRVSVPSPPDKLFWDRTFMHNAGTFYSQYFLGWPALLAPFTVLGLAWLANPVYLMLTVPAWFSVMRHAAGGTWARVGTLLLVISPMVLLGSGTLLSHTSGLCLLTWSLWAALRAGEARAAWWTPALLGTCFSGAFFVRPLTAIGLGAPFLGVWAYRTLRGRQWTRLLAFLVPTAALALLFLLVNQWQNGAPTTVAYQRVVEYAIDNDFRFSGMPESREATVADFQLRSPRGQVRFFAVGLTRLTFAALGWPTWAFLLLLLPLRRPAVRLHASMVLSFLAFHSLVGDWGVDTFGPAHLFELVLPVTALFMAIGSDWQRKGTSVFGLRPWPVFWAGILLSLTFYTPIRLLTAHAVTTSIRRAPDLTADLAPAIVYVSLSGWSPQCEEDAPGHFRFDRPNPRPDWSDPVLYANHLSVEEDLRHRDRHFPDRAAYVLYKERHVDSTCSMRLVDLDSPEADQVPPGDQVYP